MSVNDDIPFNRNFPLQPNVVDEVAPGVRRLLCNNPSPFTFTGTVSYIVGKGEADIPTIVRASYIGIDPRLMNAAGYSVLAHLEDLVARGVVATDGDPVIGGSYRMA